MRYKTGTNLVTYRVKRKKEEEAQIVFGHTQESIDWMDNASLYALAYVVETDTNNDFVASYMHFLPHPEGYSLVPKYKDSPIQELFVSINQVGALPPWSSGDLVARRAETRQFRQHGIIAKLEGWKDTVTALDTLFGLSNRLLLPGGRVAPYTDPLFHIKGANT